MTPMAFKRDTEWTKVVAIGEVLVEMMADEQGEGFREPLHLIGPFPSGAPAIFIDQVAKLGQPCGMISCVGRRRLRAAQCGPTRR